MVDGWNAWFFSDRRKVKLILAGVDSLGWLVVLVVVVDW